jgi:hypothetical protein
MKKHLKKSECRRHDPYFIIKYELMIKKMNLLIPQQTPFVMTLSQSFFSRSILLQS